MTRESRRISSVRILTERQLRRCVDLDAEALEVIDDAFTWLAERPVDMPPVQHISVIGDAASGPVGDVDIKSAFVPGLDRFAIKIASGFFGNTSLGLPTGSGLMVVLDTDTGLCRAVLLDNGYLTDLRTALAGGVAARHLAPDDVEVAGVLGTGRQAELQARALHLVRPFSRLLIHGRTPAHASRLADRLRKKLDDVTLELVSSPREVIRRSRCVVTTTAAHEPLVRAEWLHPGLHITAMGSDLPGKQELAPETLLRADLCVFDRRAQCERLGELQHVAEDRRAELAWCELGEVTSGAHAGRIDASAVTVCDLTGTGVQDTAIASHVLEKAEALGFGSEIDLA